jgi:hypothetical protein
VFVGCLSACCAIGTRIVHCVVGCLFALLRVVVACLLVRVACCVLRVACCCVARHRLQSYPRNSSSIITQVIEFHLTRVAGYDGADGDVEEGLAGKERGGEGGLGEGEAPQK